MTRTTSTTHPNGTKYTALAPYWVKYSNLLGWREIRNPKGFRGVEITRPDGTIEIKKDEDYKHITPLEPEPNEIVL